MSDNLLTEEFLNYLKFERHFSPHTAKCYAADLAQFCAFLIGGTAAAAGRQNFSGGGGPRPNTPPPSRPPGGAARQTLGGGASPSRRAAGGQAPQVAPAVLAEPQLQQKLRDTDSE